MILSERRFSTEGFSSLDELELDDDFDLLFSLTGSGCFSSDDDELEDEDFDFCATGCAVGSETEAVSSSGLLS